jgi:putative restriction endonuclease
MANLDGSRSHGGKYDILAGAVLRDEPAHFTHIYRTLLTAARAEGINQHRLPDFIALEHDGEFDLLGQDELGPSALENAFQDQIA